MPAAPKSTEKKLTSAINAWETLRPDKTFGGVDLAGFKATLKPSFDLRSKIAALESQLKAAKSQRTDADKVSKEALQSLVKAVVGDPEEGDDGDLYESLGYIRRSERRSGLHRGKSASSEPSE